MYTFLSLADEYTALLVDMRVDASFILTERARVILARANAHRKEWDEVEQRTRVPRLWGIASFERECNSDYACSPAQGDPWNMVSVHEPTGIGPYHNWGDSCVAAYAIDNLDDVQSWTWSRACYEGELFNGFGPRNHGRRTGYLWSWSNIYTGGKYTSDNHWNENVIDQQCGMIPLMKTLVQLDPSLALSDAYPTIAPAIEDTRWVQTRLNVLGAHLVIDGNYGRVTRRAVVEFQKTHSLTPDGLIGPLTLAALRQGT